MSNDAAKPAGATRRPYHVGVAIGLSTSAYAMVLAGVTSAQADHDRRVISDREPMVDAVSLLASGHDRMQARIEAARSRYAAASDRYAQAAQQLGALQADLDRLARTLTRIEGTTFAAPPRISAPAAAGVRPLAAAPAPAPPPTQATTGASGKP